MHRITITLDEPLAKDLDALVASRGYQNRSEAVRDLVRAGMLDSHNELSSENCVASLSYVYDHGTRDLPKLLAKQFQQHHDVCIAATRVALDHESTMEVCVLKGPTVQVKALAEKVIAERGVRHGKLALLPATIAIEKHAHGGGHAHVHAHVKV